MENMKKVLERAYQERYAVPQFNIHNLEWTRFILEQANEDQSPVILGVSEKTVPYMGGYIAIASMVNGLVQSLNIKVPVVLHLDHGTSVESCKSAIDAGFTSVMIDASLESLEKNILITQEVVEYAHSKNVTVEAELGHISNDGVSKEEMYTTVSDAFQFAQDTHIDALAPAFGSVHGLYQEEPKLDFTRLQAMHVLLSIPLVLHGGSGIKDGLIQKCIQDGIAKINVNTDLQVSFASSIRNYLKQDERVYDPRNIIGASESSLKQVVHDKIILFGSNQKG